jgi:hypothetical protein
MDYYKLSEKCFVAFFSRFAASRETVLFLAKQQRNAAEIFERS